ncbi:MAG: GNAT family N-acetyltransferase, partial [Gammaproteobacteria bacterium]
LCCIRKSIMRRFLTQKRDYATKPLLGIFLYSGQHIGNIKLGFINTTHYLASISLFLGSRNSQGKGYGMQAINLLKNYAFDTIGLKKLTAGMYSDNIASLKAFLKSGFQLEGIFKNHYELSNGKRTDVFQLGCLNKQ